MATRARLGLYLRGEEIKKQIKVAAARRGITATDYCTQAIEERLIKDGEISSSDLSRDKQAFLSSMDRLGQEIGSVDISAAELVREGRRK